MWSYPIVSNGLIYVVDIRNGLYVLRYTGPRALAEEVAGIGFLEGNSNLGDAARLETGSVGGAAAQQVRQDGGRKTDGHRHPAVPQRRHIPIHDQPRADDHAPH